MNPKETRERFVEQSEPPSDKDLSFAEAVVRAVVQETAVTRLPGSRLMVKCESEQVSGSFKIRGATHAVARTNKIHVVTGSSGNHGVAITRAAADRGIRATVFMTRNASPVKRRLIIEAGAEVVVIDGGNEERDAAARVYAESIDGAFISSHADPAIIAGQATVAMDIMKQVPDVTDIYVPVGGGGLLAGTCLATRATKIRVIGVEPRGADRYSQSLRAGRPVTLDRVRTICDGARAAVPSALPFGIIAALAHRVISVSDRQTTSARRSLNELGIRAEITGALAVAGLLSVQHRKEDVPVAVVSGGNGW